MSSDLPKDMELESSRGGAEQGPLVGQPQNWGARVFVRRSISPKGNPLWVLESRWPRGD